MMTAAPERATVAVAAAILSNELRDCPSFTDPGSAGPLFCEEFGAIAEPPADPRAWNLWARRAHLRFHARTGTGCPLQQEVLAQLDAAAHPEYFSHQQGR